MLVIFFIREPFEAKRAQKKRSFLASYRVILFAALAFVLVIFLSQAGGPWAGHRAGETPRARTAGRRKNAPDR